jgi:hypothetical protein
MVPAGAAVAYVRGRVWGEAGGPGPLSLADADRIRAAGGAPR